MQNTASTDTARGTGKFQLPTRIRNTPGFKSDIAVRLELADRMADLPGIYVDDNSANAAPIQARVILQTSAARRPSDAANAELCLISCDGVLVHGLSWWDQNQVIMRGWGRLRRSGVLLHMPRNTRELDVCLEIVEQARRAILEGRTRPSSTSSVWPVARIARL